MPLNGSFGSLVSKLNPWLAATVIAVTLAYGWAERDHQQLRAEIAQKADTVALSSALTLLRRDLTDIKKTADSTNARLRDIFCEGKGPSCR